MTPVPKPESLLGVVTGVHSSEIPFRGDATRFSPPISLSLLRLSHLPIRMSKFTGNRQQACGRSILQLRHHQQRTQIPPAPYRYGRRTSVSERRQCAHPHHSQGQRTTDSAPATIGGIRLPQYITHVYRKSKLSALSIAFTHAAISRDTQLCPRNNCTYSPNQYQKYISTSSYTSHRICSNYSCARRKGDLWSWSWRSMR